MEYENITLEVKDGIASICLNRPKVYNALCAALNKDMESALNELVQNSDVRALIITGGSKVFAAGADIREMLTANPFEARESSCSGHLINNTIEALPFPVIAAVCGPALGGGCELALACDFRILGENAQLGLPEVGLGIIPGAGGTQRLVRLIGAARAKEMILLGKTIKATEAMALGLATAVVPDDLVQKEAIGMAHRLAEKPASALMLAKQAVNYGETFGGEAGKVIENILFGMAFSSTDQIEGMTAFVERRRPIYRNMR